MPQYVVAMRGPSGFTFKRDSPLQVKAELSGGHRVDFTLHSIFPDSSGPEVAMSREVWVDARGEADSLAMALEAFTNLGRGFLAIVSVVTNGPVGHVLAELGYDASPGISDREFFQQFIPKHTARPTPARVVPVEACRTFIALLAQATEKERLERAIGHYHHALQHWELGNETIALSHLWMAVEALTKGILRDHMSREGKTEADLLAAWSIELKELDAEVRRRLVFQGDTDTYQSAKRASDAYEHSFESLDAVRERAAGTRHKTATYIRQAIFRLTGLSSDLFGTLTSSPYDKPYFMGTVAYARGRLLSESDALTAPGEVYPRLHWVHKSSRGPDDRQPVKYHETIQPVIARHVQFRPERLELWGGPPESPTTQMSPPTFTSRKDREEAPGRRGCIGWLVRWLPRPGTGAVGKPPNRV